MRRGARLLALLAIALLFGLACQSAFGYWSGEGETGTGVAGAASVEPGAAPTATEGGEGDVTVSWEAATLSNAVAVDGYLIQRYDAATAAAATIGPACAGTIAALTCTEAEVPEGEWEYTVTPVFGANWRGEESAKSGGVATALAATPASRVVLGSTAASQSTGGDGSSPESESTEAESPEATDEATTPQATPAGTAPTGGSGSEAEGPTNSLSLVGSVGAYLSSGNLYYDGNAAGSFTLSDALAGGAGPAAVSYPALEVSGWAHTTDNVATPAGGPYDSIPFSWAAQSESPGTYPVSGEDAFGAVTTTTLTFVDDQAPPSGGSITYPAGTMTTLSVPIATVDGTDSLSGVDAEAGRIERDEATLDPTTGICGTLRKPSPRPCPWSMGPIRRSAAGTATGTATSPPTTSATSPPTARRASSRSTAAPFLPIGRNHYKFLP